MKTITVSFLLIVALATILFLSVWGLTGSVDAAKGAAAFAVTALPSVSSWLEQSEAKRSIIPGYKMAIRSIDGFSISLPVLVAVGTMIALAILIIGNAFSSFVLKSVRSVFSQAPELSDAEKAARNFTFRTCKSSHSPGWNVSLGKMGQLAMCKKRNTCRRPHSVANGISK